MERCSHCNSTHGFYRMSSVFWCNACGHRKVEPKRKTQAPTSAPEMQIRRLAKATQS